MKHSIKIVPICKANRGSSISLKEIGTNCKPRRQRVGAPTRASELKITLFSVCFLLVFIVASNEAKAGFISRAPAYLGLNSGLVGCWTFDGAFTKAPDCSGNNNTGTLTNGPTRAAGKVGQAIDFDGVNDYVSVPSNSSLSITGAITLAAWVYPVSLPASDHLIIDKRPDTGFSGYFLDLKSNQTIRFIHGSSTHDLTSDGTIPLNAWSFVVVTDDLSNARIYFNGKLEKSGAVSGTPINSGTLGIGTFVATPTSFPFSGRIDEVRVYNRALSDAEIERLHRIGLGSKQNRPQTSTPLDQGLVGHWTFDGPDISGTRAKDRSGQNNHGTLTNGPVQAVGRIGQALEFDGSNDYVDVADSASLDAPNNVSVCFWIYWPTFGTDDYHGIMAKRLGTGETNYGFNYNPTAGTNIFQWYYRPAGFFRIHSVTLTTNFSTQQWTHICGTFKQNGASTDSSIYKNGVVLSTATLDQNVTANSSTVSIGRTLDSGAPEYGNSIIDEIRVYNRALSADEIRRLYEMARPKFNVTKDTLTQGLVGHWTFDGPDISGTRAKDRSGQNNHGTLTNGPVQAVGRIGQALNFDGVNDYVDIPDATSLDITRVTIAAWVRHDSSTFKAWEAIVAKGGSAYRIHICGLASFCTLDTFSFGTTIGTDAETGSNVVPQVGRWYHVAATFDGSTKRIYVDGVLNNSTSLSGSIDTNALALGIGENTGDTGRQWTGLIDEVRVYNRALSAEEVRKLYEMGR